MKTDKLFYGAAYYDEYIPYDRIETDMEMMERAGMNLIRIAESTWSTWEPQEGVFNFTSLHRMLDAARHHNISVIVGTPTYAIPSWLAKKSDDILAVTHNGPERYGRRQNMDITNPVYLEHAKIIIEKLMQEVRDEPHVIGFQLDNETKSYDTCGVHTQQMFVEELKKKFPDISEFNHEFGLDYWSNRVDSWEDFPDIRGTINASLAAEYSRFQRKLVTDFLQWQADIVASYKRPDQFITQNFDYSWVGTSFGIQPEVDQWQACKCMDVAGCDIYHPSQDALTGCEITACGNISRSLMRDNYFVLETEAQGNQAWLPYPGQLRLQAYSHIANGANCVEYWHWHSIHNSLESYWKGVLSHDFSENETYRECSIVGNEWKRIGAHIKNLKKVNRVAVMADNSSLTALTNFPTETLKEHSYNTVFRWLCDALFRMNIEYDVIPADASLLKEYDCVLVPALYSAPESLLTAMDAYVRDGGNLVMTYKSAFSDAHLKIYHDTQPHILHKTFGLHYDQFTYPKDVTVSCNGVTGNAREWMELITCDEASPVAAYGHPVWNRYAAAAENSYGDGHTLYLATLFDEAVLIQMLDGFFRKIRLSETAKLSFDATYPVSIKQGINDLGKHIVYLLNYSAKEQTVTNIGQPATELLSDTAVAAKEAVTLDPWGLAILEIDGE